MERKEQAFGQQRVLHTEEVAALGARAAFVRKEQSSHVAAGAELRLAQRSIREAEVALKARELLLAAQHEQILAEDFELNERAAAIPAVLESAAADIATLQMQLSEQQQLTAVAVADAAAAAANGNRPMASPATLNATDAIAGLGQHNAIPRDVSDAPTNAAEDGSRQRPETQEGAVGTASADGLGDGMGAEIERVRRQMQDIEQLRRASRAQRLNNGGGQSRTGAYNAFEVIR